MRLGRIITRFSRRRKALTLAACVLAVLYVFLFLHISWTKETGVVKVRKQMDAEAFLRRPHRVWLHPRPLAELRENKAPNMVFYVWCDNRTFTFQDYLSVVSAWRLLEPDSLEIHRGADILQDKYNNWLTVMNETMPSLVVKPIPGQLLDSCANPLQYVADVLRDRGGMYLNFSTVLTKSELLKNSGTFRQFNFSLGLDSSGGVSLMSSRIKEPLLRSVWDISRLSESASKSGNVLCVCPTLQKTQGQVLRIETSRTHEMCLTLPRDLGLKPLDLLTVQNHELSVLKDMYYTNSESKTNDLDKMRVYDTIYDHGPLGTDLEMTNKNRDMKGVNFAGVQTGKSGQKSSYPSAIPNIVHYVWFGASELSFRMYLSFLSSIHVAKADFVFIHTDGHLRGYYWGRVASHPLVTVVYREAPRQIYGHTILYTQHRSDIARADIMDKYGGMYVDWDVLWLRSPAALLDSGHEAIVSFDHMPRASYPDTINLGVLLAKPRSQFVRLWREALRNYRSRDFFHNALELPYKVYERHPDTLHIENRLQVMCFWLKCHPTFHPDYKNWQQAQEFDWKTDVYSIHFTHPDPPQFESIVDLLNGNGTFADIGKFILTQAGELGLHRI